MYTRVESQFWHDEKVRQLSIESRYLMLYLLTSPHRNLVGIYYLPIPYACFDLGWDEKQFQKSLKELIEKGIVSYDEETNMVLVKNYLKHNPLENQNQVKGAIQRLNELPKTFLIVELYETVKNCNNGFPDEFIEALRTLSELFRKSYETLSKPLPNPFEISNSNSISSSNSKEKEINKEREIAPDGAVGSDEPTSQSIKEVFDYYNEVFKDCWSKPLLLTPQRKKKISARLRNFTPEELKTVIHNIRASPFHCGENDKGRIYATPEFIFRNDEIVDKWLKEEPKYGGIGGYNPPQVVEV